MFERFTDRSRRVVVLAQEEARILDHNYIDTEHILLGLIREGDGVAVLVLVQLGADPNRVRQQVLQLRHGHSAEELAPEAYGEWELRMLPGVSARLEALDQRLTAIEQRAGTGPDLAERIQQLADEIERIRAALRRHGIDPQDRPA